MKKIEINTTWDELRDALLSSRGNVVDFAWRILAKRESELEEDFHNSPEVESSVLAMIYDNALDFMLGRIVVSFMKYFLKRGKRLKRDRVIRISVDVESPRITIAAKGDCGNFLRIIDWKGTLEGN